MGCGKRAAQLKILMYRPPLSQIDAANVYDVRRG